MVTKLAGGAIGIFLIGSGSIAVAKPEWLGMDYMPKWHPLSEDNDYETKTANDYSSGKFGSKHKNYLVGVTNNKEDTSKNNFYWWEWSFRKLQREKPDKGKFSLKKGDKKVEAGYDDSNSKSLHKVCQEAYQKKDDSDNFGENDSNGTKFKKTEVWKYCSPVGQEPKTIQANNKTNETTPGTIGAEKQGELISVLDSGNDIFWDIRNQEFKAKDLSTNSSHLFFKNRKNGKKDIKKICEEAYRQTKSTPEASSNDKPTTEETKAYCSLTMS